VLLKVKKRKKECGILLPMSSLPSEHGIGTFGEQAYKFIDLLHKCRQDYWQILPLCPFGKGNSPYSSESCFAGEILYIDLDMLVEDGLLKKSDLKKTHFDKNVDYKKVRAYKLPILKKAAKNFNTDREEYKSFVRENSAWLNDFALFMAIKEKLDGIPFLRWEEGLKFRDKTTLENFEKAHKESVEFYKITQYLFFNQYNRLHDYAALSGVKIIGDIPFYLSAESADVWQNPEIFKLGRDLTPVLISGVPPDIFSANGQLWENPIYNWDYLKSTDYAWWRERLVHNSLMYDVLRIDHFRAFADYYTIPSGAADARTGRWEKGAGTGFWEIVKPYIKNCEIIAEDLGGENSPLVQGLIEQTGFPNMKVLQFAFNSDSKNLFLPKNFGYNCVCYTGTHDNNTTEGWYRELDEEERATFERFVPKGKFFSPSLRLIAYAMKSDAKTVIIPFQDYLQADASCRINIPGTSDFNWEWRFSATDLTSELTKTIIKLTKLRKNRLL